MPGKKQARLLAAYNPDWKRQANFSTAMALEDLTAVMPPPPESAR